MDTSWRSKRVSAIWLAALLGAAASARGAPAPEPPRQLAERVHGLHLDPACGDKIALEWAASFPVPVEGPPRGYRVLFYPVKRSGRRAAVLTPAAAALLPLEGADAVSCEALDDGGAAELGPALSEESRKLDPGELLERRRGLHVLTERVAELYFQRAGGREAKRLASRYFREFTALMQPGLRERYRSLNPGFWKWIQDLTGNPL